MIKQPTEMTFSDKKFSMILYGSPGVGKTTLALSAPAPLLIDFDRGVSRVKAQHRTATIECAPYDEVLKDLKSPEMKDFETVVVDTGGSFITILQGWAMKKDPKLNCQKNGQISLKGFGAVKNEFNRFTSYVKDVLNKNLIYVFHSQEQTGADGQVQQRIMCEGATKNSVWTPCDFGGYVQMIGDSRVVCFTPEQEFFAKGCHGIKGQMKVPTLSLDEPNDFITRLFESAKNSIAAENEAFTPLKEQYDAVMEEVRGIIEHISDAESANEALEILPSLDHVLTSKREASALLKAKAEALGLEFKDGEYTAKVA